MVMSVIEVMIEDDAEVQTCETLSVLYVHSYSQVFDFCAPSFFGGRGEAQEKT